MDVQEIIKYHQKQLNYNVESNKLFRSMDKWQKTGRYKDVYVKAVTKYRERIKFHTEVINTLRGVVNV